jgi:dCMP deaminase
MQPWKMPSRDEYYMGIAVAVREKANCLGSRVGAVIVRDNRVISTGYNGVPEGMQNCLDGGCHRCSNTAIYKSGEAYDLCICVHAEQNALITAARFGIAVFGATLYTTMKPCFNCAKEVLQAGIAQVCYIHEWQPGDDRKRAEHDKIIGAIKLIRKIDYPDPRPEWIRAISRPKTGDGADVPM